MKNKGSFLGNFVLILLLAVLAFTGYYLYQNLPRTPINLEKNIQTQQPIVDNDIPSKQFYERMRYPDRTINYYISSSCPSSKADYMREAMDFLEIKTSLRFNPTSKENSELNVLCSDISPEADERDHFVAGEGGPSRVLNATLYSVILEGKIALYRDGNCNNYNVALHELLHALGFDHNNNRNSILYPTLDCNQRLDDEIVDSINSLYEDDSLPDLVFAAVNATKSGRFLDFHIEVLNEGLKQANDVKVSLFADGQLVQIYENGEYVDHFTLGTISIGSKKIIDVQNLKVPLNAKKIDFVIDNDEEINELYENNNKVTLNSVE